MTSTSPAAAGTSPAPVRSRAAARRGRTTPQGHRASVTTYILVILALAFFGVPFIWVVLTSLATPAQLGASSFQLLHVHPQWSNFAQATTLIPFWRYAGNSLFLSLLTATLSTASSATVGFAFARLKARGRTTLFTVVLATMMIPAIATLIPTYVLFARVGLVGTYWPWVLWGLAGVPYLIFLFRQFFSSIPLELEDAAIIDGCGWVSSYLRIFLPLARTVLLTSFLLSFTWTWGDYLAPSLLLNSNNMTLAVAVAYGYLDPHGIGIVTVQAAGAILFLLPVIVLFGLTQRYFMGSSLGSSVKG